MGRPPNLETILDRPDLFIQRLEIVNKKGKLQRLLLNSEQKEVLVALARGDDTLVLKPRQIGSTTLVAAYFFWRAYTAKSPETFAIISHKMTSSKHILNIHRRFYNSLPKPMQRPLEIDNQNTIKFRDTGAQIIAVSSEGSGGLRSFTCTGAHISEFAFQDNTDELKATALAALNGGQLCIESTANFYGDALHKEIELWEGGLVDWSFIFFPWFAHEEYRQKPPKGWEGDPESDLTPHQQYWQERMIGKLGVAKFRREYPSSVEDAYAQLEDAWIPQPVLRELSVIKFDDVEGGQFVQGVEEGDSYAIGVDCGAGTGGDYSALVVVSRSTGQPVEVRRSNEMTPSEWAEVVADASFKWNNAKVLVESNGTWGGIIVTELKHAGVPQWTDSNGKYWTTTHQSRLMMLENIKDLLGRGQVTHLDSWTVGELRSFKMNERDEPFVPRGGIHHGDTVTAMALAYQCVKSVSAPRKQYLPQWIVDRKIQRFIDRQNHVDKRRYE
jgi:hypothetical protein